MTITAVQNKIGQKDINFWDGQTRTFTRLTSSGGSLTLTKIGNVVDPCAVYGTGTTKTSAILNTAISQIGTNQVGIDLTPGDWVISENVTIPSNISVIVSAGARLQVATGITVTMPPGVFAGRYQWIELTGTGKVSFTGQDIGYPEWWGAVCDSSTDCTTAFQTAVDSGVKTFELVTSSSYYKLTDEISVTGDGITFIGGYVKQATASKCGFIVEANDFLVDRMKLQGPQYAAYDASETAIKAVGVDISNKYNSISALFCEIYEWGHAGLYGEYCDRIKAFGCRFHDIVYCGAQGRNGNFHHFAHNEAINITPGVTATGLAVGFCVSSNVTTGTPRYNRIVNNYVENVTYQGINCEPAQDTIVMGNVIKDCVMHIAVSHYANPANPTASDDQVSERVIVCDNYCFNESATYLDEENRYWGIGIGGYDGTRIVSDVSCHGNVLDSMGGNQGGSNLYGALHLRHIDNVSVRGNKFKNSYWASICVNSNVTNANIQSNDFYSMDGVNDVSHVYFRSTGNDVILVKDNVSYDTSSLIYASVATPGARIGKNYVLGGGTEIATYTNVNPDHYQNLTTVGVTGTANDDLMSITILAEDLSPVNSMSFTAMGTKSGTAGNKTIKLYIGSTTITVHPAANNELDWIVIGTLSLATAETKARVSWTCFCTTSVVGSGYELVDEDFTADVTMKFYAEVAGAGDMVSQVAFLREYK